MSDFKIVGKKAKVDQCYGLEAFHITKEEIAALLAGKKLYSTVNCGEYAITIELRDRVTLPESKLEKNSKKLEKDLGESDCISRADAIRVASGYCHPSNVAAELAKLPPVTPQEPKSEWQQDHEILKAYSDGASEVLEKIRSEIETKYGRCKLTEPIVQYDGICTGINDIGDIADILQIIDKYTAESAHDVAQEIVKNNGVVDL